MSQRLAAEQQEYEDQLGGSSGTLSDPREYDEEMLKELGVTEGMDG